MASAAEPTDRQRYDGGEPSVAGVSGAAALTAPSRTAACAGACMHVCAPTAGPRLVGARDRNGEKGSACPTDGRFGGGAQQRQRLSRRVAAGQSRCSHQCPTNLGNGAHHVCRRGRRGVLRGCSRGTSTHSAVARSAARRLRLHSCSFSVAVWGSGGGGRRGRPCQTSIG